MFIVISPHIRAFRGMSAKYLLIMSGGFIGMVKKLRISVAIVAALAVALSTGGVAVGSERADLDNLTSHPRNQQEGEEKGLQEGKQGESDQDNLASQAKISKKQAKKAAKKAAKGSVTEVELDEQNGKVVYEVDVGNNEVIVNAKNGKVISVNYDDNGDDDDNDMHGDDHDDRAGREKLDNPLSDKTALN